MCIFCSRTLPVNNTAIMVPSCYQNLIKRLSENLKDFDPDVTFNFPRRLGGGQIKGHRLILSAASPVFRAMFSGRFRERNRVEIDDIPHSTFQRLMG